VIDEAHQVDLAWLAAVALFLIPARTAVDGLDLDEQYNILSTAENPGTWVYVYSAPAAAMQFKTWPKLRLAAWSRVL
jgi:hypothetical protein